ncbi:MAG: hypothetical protein JWR52_1941 [Marmoricola sp.]|nr:hypothetical protein [Marmoricola sp.]
MAAGLGVLLSGCATSRAAAGAPSVYRAAAPSAALATTPAVLPSPALWHPSSGDFDPRCKLAAVRWIERAGTGPNRRVSVIDAQYGGLLTSSASVLVVTRSWTLANGVVTPSGRTYDVRLSRRSSGWHVDAVHPSRPGPPAPLSSVARRVLSDDRIVLPPAARRDVRSGLVHHTTLAALLTLARDFRIGVSVIRSGHPLYVFGTNRLSDHPRGRAFDTWQINGRSVVDPRTSRHLVTEYMHAAASAGSYNVGGPYLLGSAPQWFSDRTHHDHVHAGFLT